MTPEQINVTITSVTGVYRDYATCLNAMHDAEKALNEDQKYKYVAILAGGDWSEPWSFDDAAKAVSATASQRAEAFLKCLGKWVD